MLASCSGDDATSGSRVEPDSGSETTETSVSADQSDVEDPFSPEPMSDDEYSSMMNDAIDALLAIEDQCEFFAVDLEAILQFQPQTEAQAQAAIEYVTVAYERLAHFLEEESDKQAIGVVADWFANEISGSGRALERFEMAEVPEPLQAEDAINALRSADEFRLTCAADSAAVDSPSAG